MDKIKIIKLSVLLLSIFLIISCTYADKERRTAADAEGLSKEAVPTSKRTLKKRKAEKVKKETQVYDIHKEEEDVIIFGVSEKRGKEEKVFTLFGSFTITPDSGAETGYSVYSGDIDGDGTRDIIIGSPNTRTGERDKGKSGKVYCLYGKKEIGDVISVGDSELILYNKSALSEKDWLGHAIAVGDINGDDIDDLIIGAPFMSDKRGAVFVVFGKKGISGENDIKSIADISIYGANKGDMAGYSIATGDINSDGKIDIIIGAPGADGQSGKYPDAGDVYIIFGGKSIKSNIDLKQNYDIKISGEEDRGRGIFVFSKKAENKGANVGYAVSSGDINGDGISDIVIGSPGADIIIKEEKKDAGKVYIIYGKKGLEGILDLNKGANIIINGVYEGNSTGYSVVCSDMNKDGLSDIIIGAPNASLKGGKERPGAVYVVYGRPMINNSTELPYNLDLNNEADSIIYGRIGEEEQTIILSTGISLRYFFGYSLASGDFNGDENIDISIGAPGTYAMNSLQRKSAGEIYVVYGGDIKGEHRIEDFADILIYGSNESDMAGTSLFMDDLNGDGISDLIIGAPGAKGETENLINTGEVYFFYGGRNKNSN